MVNRALSHLQKRAHQPDYTLTILVLLLIGVGMVMLYATGGIVALNVTGGAVDRNTYFSSQSFSLLVGLVGWYLAARTPYHKWQKYAPYIFYTSIILMLLVAVPGLSQTSGGAARWIKLGPMSFQPVEFFKLGFVLFMASWLEKNKANLDNITGSLVPFLIIIGLAGFLTMVVQKDMGSGMVLVGMALSVYLVSGVPLWLFGSLLAMLSAGGVGMILLYPHRLERVSTFFSKTEDPSGAGYHINQALIALGSGGLLGRGLGRSLQAYGYLPESTNDSIFALIGEQFGLWGTLMVIFLFAILVYRGIQIARYAPDTLSRSMAVGIVAWIGFQTLINASAMLNLIPLTGVPLPFISFGGTSLVASLMAIGILQNISKYTFKEVAHASNGVGRGNSRPYRAGTRRTRRA